MALAVKNELQRIADLIRKSDRIAIGAHINPDGDCIGSALALRLVVQRLGKTADVFDRDPAPSNLAFLKGFEAFQTFEHVQEDYDLLVLVDCASTDRVLNLTIPEQHAQWENLLSHCKVHAQIDHHGTNPKPFTYNAVDADAAATGLLIWHLMDMLGVSLDCPIAECLYTAVSTDTGNFMQDNTSPECFDLMAEVTRIGMNVPHLSRILFAQRSHGQVGLITHALNSLRFLEDGKVSGMRLTHEDMLESHALPEDSDTVVNFARDIQGVDMAVMARETDEGVKISLRAIAPWKIDGIAKAHAGGGHHQAAGCTLHDMTAEEALEKIMGEMVQAHRAQEKELS